MVTPAVLSAKGNINMKIKKVESCVNYVLELKDHRLLHSYDEAVITFKNGVFQSCKFPFSGNYTYDQWQILGQIAGKIKELQENLKNDKKDCAQFKGNIGFCAEYEEFRRNGYNFLRTPDNTGVHVLWNDEIVKKFDNERDAINWAYDRICTARAQDE